MEPRRSKVILLAGAGLSSLAGIQTLKSIVDSITVPLDTRDPRIELVKETWKVIGGLWGDKRNLELLLARLKYYCQVADLIMTDHVFREQLQVKSADVVNGQFKSKWETALAYCFGLMVDNYGPQRVNVNLRGYATIHDMLRMLAGANNNFLHIFTTNYDCVTSVLAERSDDLNVISHISNQTGHFEKEWFVVNKKNFRDDNLNIYVHRLHGCVAWFSEPKSSYGVREKLGAGTQLAKGDQDELNQMAIKLVPDEKIGNFPAFSLAFKEFRQELECCEILLVWGYSFRDVEVLRCMLDVAVNRKARPYRVLCIEPYLRKEVAVHGMR